MVIKVAEYSGTLNCKNCVIVPYSSQQSQSSKSKTSKTVIKQSNLNHCGSQTVSTSLFNDSKTEELWHKQFSRWWAWNWQRKRKSLLKKLGVTKTYYEQKPAKKVTKNKSIECHLTSNHKIDNLINDASGRGRLHQATNYEYGVHDEPDINNFIPMFSKCPSRINEPYKSRKRRNKHKERIYEGWVREVSSDDTEESDTNIVVKGGQRKSNNRMHYLSLRLRKLTEINEFDMNNNKYKSPVSGKTYNLNLTKTNEVHIKPDEINNLNPKSITDQEFLVKPEFPCTTEYYKIRNEHLELLKSVCEIIKNKQSDEVEINEVHNTNTSTSRIVNKVHNTDTSSSRIVNEVHNTNTSCIVELSSLEDEYKTSFNVNEYAPNISRSLPVFMERNPPEISPKCDGFSDQIYCLKDSSYYDINYLYNNVDVFKSSITETSFIWDYLLKNKNQQQ